MILCTKLSATTKDTSGKLRTSKTSPEGSKTNIALTGFMAVGKSAVGRRLARRLRSRFVDLDRTIEKAEGMTVSEIFEQRGEAYFRKMEKQTLKEILRQDGTVIATGGGTILDQENLRLLKQRSVLICLLAPPEVLLKRAGAGDDRPLLRGTDRHKRTLELLKQREKSYAQAHASIDTGSLSVNEVVDQIVAVLGSRI